MSSFFTEQTRVVEIDEDNRVTVRKLTYGRRQQTISKASKINPVNQEASLDFAQMRVEQLVAGVVSWEGLGFEGRPVNRENILALPPEVAEKIEAGIDAFNQPLTGEEKKE